VKTARFANVVKEAGAPEAYLLWASPKKDRVFQRAVKEQRVLTVHQENVGTRKDYGRVGFHEEPHAQYLVFPKTLREFSDRRVIGIDYGLLAQESRPGPSPQIERRKVKAKPAKATTRTKQRAAASMKEDAADDADEKIVSFERPETKSSPGTARKTKRAGAAKSAADAAPKKKDSPAVDPGVLRVVRQAMKDLDAGKAVAAYKRLETLVESANAGE
jgi:hypothetical protein